MFLDSMGLPVLKNVKANSVERRTFVKIIEIPQTLGK